jgi:hypothetical protein
MSLPYYYIMGKGGGGVPSLLDQLFPFRYGFSIRKRLTNDLTYPNLRLVSGASELDVTLSPTDDWDSVLPSVVSWLGGAAGYVKSVYCQKTGIAFTNSGGAQSPLLINSDGTLVKDASNNVAMLFDTSTSLIIPSSGTLFENVVDGNSDGATIITLAEPTGGETLLANRTAAGFEQGFQISLVSGTTMRFYGRVNDVTTEFYFNANFLINTVQEMFSVWQPNESTSGDRFKVWLNGTGYASTTTGGQFSPLASATDLGWGIFPAASGSRMTGYASDFIYYESNQETNRTGIIDALTYL